MQLSQHHLFYMFQVKKKGRKCIRWMKNYYKIDRVVLQFGSRPRRGCGKDILLDGESEKTHYQLFWFWRRHRRDNETSTWELIRIISNRLSSWKEANKDHFWSIGCNQQTFYKVSVVHYYGLNLPLPRMQKGAFKKSASIIAPVKLWLYMTVSFTYMSCFCICKCELNSAALTW